MKARRCLAATLLVLVLPAAAVADHHDALMQEVKALGDALTEAMLADDTDAMLSFYAEDAISLPNFEQRMDGIEAMRQHHAQGVAAGMKIISFTSNPTEVWEAGDQVIEIGSYEIELTPPGMPQPIEDKGKYLTVYERDAEGKLKVKVETWNTDMNPMAMMGGGAPEPEHGHEH